MLSINQMRKALYIFEKVAKLGERENRFGRPYDRDVAGKALN